MILYATTTTGLWIHADEEKVMKQSCKSSGLKKLEERRSILLVAILLKSMMAQESNTIVCKMGFEFALRYLPLRRLKSIIRIVADLMILMNEHKINRYKNYCSFAIVYYRRVFYSDDHDVRSFLKSKNALPIMHVNSDSIQ